jgi:hypothetical protein
MYPHKGRCSVSSRISERSRSRMDAHHSLAQAFNTARDKRDVRIREMGPAT